MFANNLHMFFFTIFNKIIIKQKHHIICNHSDPVQFAPTDISSYFKADYYEKNKRAPRFCCGTDCYTEFGITSKVNNKNPVWCCVNCPSTVNPCNHAYCRFCYNILRNKNENQFETRKRSQTSRKPFGEINY